MSGNRQQWWCCDGEGHVGGPREWRPTRRQILGGAASAALAAWAGSSSALAGVTLAPDTAEPNAQRPCKTLVTLFLRGGADGLSLVPPHGEAAYHRLRPTIGLAGPKDIAASKTGRCLDLDGFFGLHPSLAALYPLYGDGTLAIVHAVGSQDHTRSHFEAMAAMEYGMPDAKHLSGAGGLSGWLARYLSAAPPASPSPLRAVARGDVLPESLRGATDATVLNSIADYRLNAPSAPVEKTLTALYGAGADPVQTAGRETLHVLNVLRRIDPAEYRPGNGAVYPKSDTGDGLRQVACLIRARIGLEVAFLDHRGPYSWDTHVAQTAALPAQAKDLADALAAFATDLGPAGLQDVAVVAVTEFGRRAEENSGLGTDHGRGSVLFALGGPVRGGKVYSVWPGLEDHQLEAPGDLRVTTDYRQVLAEVVTGLRGDRFPAHDLFPGLTPGKPLGIATV